MKLTTFYKYGMIFLLVLNLLLVGFLVLNHPSNRKGPPKDHHRQGPPENHQGLPQSRVFDQLELNDEQLDFLKASAARHREKMNTLSEQQHIAMSNYLLNPEATNADKYISNVEKFAGMKLTATNDHFNELKSILTEEQQEKYQPFIEKAINNIFPKTTDRPRPPRK